MVNHIQNILEGMASLCPAPRDYQHPTGGGFSRDARNINKSFGAVSKDMYKALDKYEQTETNSRKIK